MITNVHLQKTAKKFVKELTDLGRDFHPIKFELKSKKAAGVYGTAYYSYEAHGYDRITINPYIENEDDFINTLLHELAHVDKEARKHGHGPKWKKVAKLYGQLYNTKITTTSDKEIKIPGSIQVKVIWSSKCLELNKHLKKEMTRIYTSKARALNFIKKYDRIGFIENFDMRTLY